MGPAQDLGTWLLRAAAWGLADKAIAASNFNSPSFIISLASPFPLPPQFIHGYLIQFRPPSTATATRRNTTRATLQNRFSSWFKSRWPASTDIDRPVRAISLPLYLRSPLARPDLRPSNATCPPPFHRLLPIPHAHPRFRRSPDEARRLQHTRRPHHEPARTNGTSPRMRLSARRA